MRCVSVEVYWNGVLVRVASRTVGANIPRYSIDIQHVLPADICEPKARLEGHDQDLQRVVENYRSTR